MITLRDYQQDCVTAILRDWDQVDRTLAVLATGTGKTVIYLALLDELRHTGMLRRALIIAHRRELIYQPIERAQEMFPGLYWYMGVVMADQDETNARVIVATVQSLAIPGRLERILEAGRFSHVIIDECHHSNQASYMSVLDRLGPVKVLGVTATPLRTDGDGLRKVFQRVSYRMPITSAIERGALAPFDALGVTLPVSFAGLRETEDGWEAEGAGDILSAQNALDIILEKWRQYAGDRQTILFTASVAQAERTAAYFSQQGVAAAWVCGETPKDERDRILADYKAGRVQLIANCMVLTEGFDAPETSAIVMAAPTKSDLIYVQRLGRGLRTAPGKENCRVLDFVPLASRNVVMAGDMLGKPRKVKKAEEQAERSGILVAWSVSRNGDAAEIDPDDLIVRTLNLLRKSELAWTVQDHYLTATLSADAALCIVLPDPARIAKAEAARNRGELFGTPYEALYDYIRTTRLYLVERDESTWAWRATSAGTFANIEEAKHAADGLANELLDATLAQRAASWRREPATPKQLQFMARLGVRAPGNCSKGRAAQLITQALTMQAVARAERVNQAAIVQQQGIAA